MWMILRKRTGVFMPGTKIAKLNEWIDKCMSAGFPWLQCPALRKHGLPELPDSGALLFSVQSLRGVLQINLIHTLTELTNRITGKPTTA